MPIKTDTESGSVTLDVGDVEIGAVEIKDATSTDRLAVDADGFMEGVVLRTSASEIGAVLLHTGASSIGNVKLETSTSSIGEVKLQTSPCEIGAVILHTGASSVGNVKLETSTSSIGEVKLQTSASDIGKVNAASMIGTGASGGAAPSDYVVIAGIGDDGNIQSVIADGDGLVVEQHIAHMIHLGKEFIYSHLFLTPAAGSAGVMIDIPSSISPHMVWSVAGGADLLVELYETPTVSASGTSGCIWNFNRSSPSVAAASMAASPTITATGSILLSNFVPGGADNKATGGAVRQETDWILNTGSYLLAASNLGAGEENISILIELHEAVA